jgi:hypothetical protein
VGLGEIVGGLDVNHTLAAAERRIADIESRIARQLALIEERARSGLDTEHAKRALRTLEQALDLTRQLTRTLLAPAARPARPMLLPAE